MDYYQTLGVAKNATPDEIKKAYRKLASQHHPDKGGDKAMFQKVEEAYRILGDPQKKSEYDNPASGFGFTNMNGQNFPGGFSFNVNGMDFGDIFGAMFGQQQQSRYPTFRTTVNVTLEMVYKGSSQTLQLQTQHGPKVINIEIPRGIKNGEQMRFDNVMDAGILIIEFRIQPDLKFERRGNDLYSTHSISILDLIVGTTFNFTTISGKTLQVNVKPKTQPNMQLKLPGQGMPIFNTSVYGDQIIMLNPYIPDTIDESITQSILQAKNK